MNRASFSAFAAAVKRRRRRRAGLSGADGGAGGGNDTAYLFAPSPAPAGYRWEYVTYGNERVVYNGEPVVALVEI